MIQGFDPSKRIERFSTAFRDRNMSGRSVNSNIGYKIRHNKRFTKRGKLLRKKKRVRVRGGFSTGLSKAFVSYQVETKETKELFRKTLQDFASPDFRKSY